MTKIIAYNNITESITTNKAIDSYVASKLIKLPAPYNKANGIKEAHILKDVKQVCANKYSWYMRIDIAGKIVRTKQAAYFAPSEMKGLSDLIALKNGTFYAIEVKRSGGTITSQQLAVLNAIHKSGGVACIVVDALKFMSDKFFIWQDFVRVF